eukprot:scpid75512/ scgid28217/ 
MAQPSNMTDGVKHSASNKMNMQQLTVGGSASDTLSRARLFLPDSRIIFACENCFSSLAAIDSIRSRWRERLRHPDLGVDHQREKDIHATAKQLQSNRSEMCPKRPKRQQTCHSKIHRIHSIS